MSIGKIRMLDKLVSTHCWSNTSGHLASPIIGQDLPGVPRTNGLAYFVPPSASKKTSLMKLTPGLMQTLSPHAGGSGTSPADDLWPMQKNFFRRY